MKQKKGILMPKKAPKEFSKDVIKKYSYISELLEKNKLSSENFNVNQNSGN